MSNQTQVEFEHADAGRTQNERLRDYLFAHPLRWVPMPELAKVITPTGIGAAVHSRVSDCREKFGMHIERRMLQRQPSYFYDPALPGNFGCQRKQNANCNVPVSDGGGR